MDEDADILDERSNLHGYLRVLRRRKWIVVLTVLAAVGITLAYSLNQPKEYSSTALVQVPPPGGQNPLSALDPTTLTVDQQRLLMQNESAFARSNAVRTAVRKQLGTTAVYGVEPVVSSSLLAITGLSGDARDASRIANTVSRTYLDESLDEQRSDLTNAIASGRTAIKSLRSQLDELGPGAAGRTDVYLAMSNLQRQIANAKARLDLMTDSGGKIRYIAVTPKAPTEPKTSRNVAIAAVVGLILGIALAFLVDRLDDRVRTKRDVDIASRGLPNLGVIPWSKSWSEAKEARLMAVAEPTSPTTEAFRTLRTSVEVLGLSGPVRTVAVTSAEPTEGKSATVANLGVVLARADHRVAIVCCDFRRPRLHDYFGVSNDRGFTNVLLGELMLDQALHAVPEVPGLSVLTSGPVPPNPSEMLSLSATGDILNQLAARFDYVIVDSPPVLPVPDSLVIARLVDGMIVVAMAKRTTKRRLERALELLDQAQAPVLGTVFTGITSADGYGYESRTTAGQGSSGSGVRGLLRRRGAAPATPPGPATGTDADADANGHRAERPDATTTSGTSSS